MAYPCICCPGGGCSSSQPTCSDCLRAASIIVSPSESVTGCGDTGSVDILSLSDFSICETSITWALVSYDTDAFTDVTLVDGVLEFTTTNAAVSGTFYEFIGKVHCTGTLLSQYFKVTVPIKNLCYGVVCSEGLVCNPCTGGCISEVDVEVL